MSVVAVEAPADRRSQSQREWHRISAARPQLAETAARYLAQLALSLRPSSVVVADAALRQLALYLLDDQPHVVGFVDVGRAEIEAFKLHLAARPGRLALVTANTLRQRLGTLRTFFDRIGEWDWDDAPRRTPIYSIDLPIVDDPLPRFLDDAQAARLLRAANDDSDPLRRLVVHLLARTGVRVGELCRLRRDGIVHSTAAGGYVSRSASCTTTATSLCTRNWSRCSPTGSSTATTTAPGCCSSAPTDGR